MGAYPQRGGHIKQALFRERGHEARQGIDPEKSGQEGAGQAVV
jgi:hypothetical protein